MRAAGSPDGVKTAGKTRVPPYQKTLAITQSHANSPGLLHAAIHWSFRRPAAHPQPTASGLGRNSGRAGHQPTLDLPHIFRTKLDVGRTGDAAHLFGAADADDRACHRGIPQGPRDGNLTRRCVVAVADGAQRLDQPQIAGEQRLLEIRAVLPPVVCRACTRSAPASSRRVSIPEAMGE